MIILRITLYNAKRNIYFQKKNFPPQFFEFVQCWIGEKEHGCQRVQHLCDHGQPLQVSDQCTLDMDWVGLISDLIACVGLGLNLIRVALNDSCWTDIFCIGEIRLEIYILSIYMFVDYTQYSNPGTRCWPG